MSKPKAVILTGAGISAESGIKTFRDADGLWEGHDVMEVASPHGWRKDRALVLDFYNQRRRQLKEVEPNAGHTALKNLEEKYEVVIVTQNVDNLHERAGSSNIIHLHGELTKSRSTIDDTVFYDCPDDIKIGDRCPQGAQMRPHIVWFGEAVPMLERAAKEVSEADVIAIIGTSMQVYPAAGLTDFARPGVPIYYIDPRPTLNRELQNARTLEVIAENASTGVPKLVKRLLEKV